MVRNKLISKNFNKKFQSISIDETDWSMQMAQEIFSNDFSCPNCNEVFNFTSIDKLRHFAVCKKIEEENTKDSEVSRPSNSNQKLFKCGVCFGEMYLTNIEILKHKKKCKIKEEKKD